MTVRVEEEGPIARLVLDRPDVLNAMDWEIFDELARCCGAIAGSGTVRVVLVTGRGSSFSSGIDTGLFGALGGASPEGLVARAQAGFRALAALAVPTVAAVKGHALGAGLQLALACDVRVVAEDAVLGLLETRYGIIPDLGGTQRLPLLVGSGHALKMIATAERISGAEAGRLGLAEVVVPPADVERAAAELAAAIAAAPPIAVREAKRLVALAGRIPLSEGMDEEAASQLKTLGSSDFAEAIGAFIDRRPPSFAGR